MTQKVLGWQTPTNGAGEHTGLIDAGVEHFKNDPMAALASEIPQNTQDAGLEGLPTHIHVRKMSIAVSDIPDCAQLREIVSRCAQASDKDKNEVAFFDRAQRILDAERIHVLALTDSNTTGLVGPCENGTPFYALMKSRGSNVKANDLARGSFGIGKMAPYLSSDIRAIFASTAYSDEVTGEIRRLVQGKTILTSHRDGAEYKDANSYWGRYEGFMPADPDMDGDAIPAWLTAPHAGETTGTTIFILGFNGPDTWEQEFVAHYLAKFGSAIHEGTATAQIGETIINRNTVSDVLNDEALATAVQSNETAEKSLKQARAYHLALSGDEIRVIFDVFGPATLRFAVGDNLPSRVAVVRNGMLITDQMDYLTRFPAMAEFAAVLQFESNETNQLLRQMEPPRHDCFEIKRLEADPKRFSRAKAGLKEAGKKIRSELVARLRGEVQDRINLSELSDRLGESDDDTTRPDASETNPLGRLLISEVLRKMSTKSQNKTASVGVAHGNKQLGTSAGEGHKANDETREKNKGPLEHHDGSASEPTLVSNEPADAAVAQGEEEGPKFVDYYPLNTFTGVHDKETGLYKMSFVAPAPAIYGLKFEAVGFSTSKGGDMLPVRSAEGAVHDKNGFLQVKATAGQKVRLMVGFEDRHYKGPVKVRSYAV